MALAVAIWICSCAYLNCAGWALSAIGQLNTRGYTVALLIWLAALFIWHKKSGVRNPPSGSFTKLRHRVQRVFPAAFLSLALIAILGGALYPPDNIDELGYRFPRVLNWLAENHWHWIHTFAPTMNDRASGFEWLMAPLFALTRSDRLFFLPNAISFLLLPGLVYSVFIRLGIFRKVAWHWMWLLPAGFNFALQAGSVASDFIGAIFALAAMDRALRFVKSRRQTDLWLSILAAGLMTGVKISNLPLLLPWFGVLMFAFRDLGRKPLVLTAVLLVATLSSCVPNSVLNFRHCDDWTGSNLENPKFHIHNPLVGIAGNAAVLGLINLQLPFMPLSRLESEKLTELLLPQKFLNFYDANFASSHFAYYLGSGIQTEEGSSLGIGIFFILTASVCAALFCRHVRDKSGNPDIGGAWSHKQQIILLVLPWISLLVYMANVGAGEQGRLLSAYYPLLLPLLLVSRAQEWIVHRYWWQWSAAAAFLMAGILVVLTPSRPLLPVQTLLKNCKSPFLIRSRVSYAANAHRSDELAPIRALIPPGTSVIGLLSTADELSLWRPFGSRRVVYLLPGDTAADLRRRGVEYVVVKHETLVNRNQSIENWLKEFNAELTGETTIMSAIPPYVPFDWYVARLRS